MYYVCVYPDLYMTCGQTEKQNATRLKIGYIEKKKGQQNGKPDIPSHPPPLPLD